MNRFGIKTLLVTMAILLIPLIAMQFTQEVNWDILDFLVGAALLGGAGLTYEVISRKTTSKAYRMVTGLTTFALVLIIWVSLAVGIR